MKVTMIADKNYQTPLFQKLQKLMERIFENMETEVIMIGREDLKFCMGCFGCWIKKPGQCVIEDRMSQINRSYNNSDLVVYLSPVIFGQFSANIKNALDRWLPNILPFFKTDSDGNTIHPSRYEREPRLIAIGYGDNLSEDDKQLFCDILNKHRNNFEVFIYQNDDTQFLKEFQTIELGKEGIRK